MFGGNFRTMEMNDTIRESIESGDALAFNRAFETIEPIDFAQMAEDFDDSTLKRVLSLLSDENRAKIFEEAEDDFRLRMAKLTDNHSLLNTFEYMQKDDIVDLLGDFPTGRRKEVLDLMKKDDRQIITKLLNYPEDSAGGIMTTAYLSLNEKLTVSQGLQKIREIAPRTEVIETIYVTDAQHRLTGSLDLRELLSAAKTETIRSIMDPGVIYVTPEVDQEEVAKKVSRYDLNSIPVVNAKKQLLGIITVDDVIDVIIEEHDEDMLQMAGVSSEERLNTSASTRHSGSPYDFVFHGSL